MGEWVFVAALALARVAFGYQFQTLASLGPELMARFGLDYAALGTLIGLYMLPGVLVALPGGLLGRRFGSRAVVGLGLGLMTAGAFLAVAAPEPGMIGAGRLVSGAGAVTLIVMQGKMVSERFPGKRFMPVMGLLVGAFPVGVGLVGLTHDPLLRAFGPGGMFVVGGALAALSLALFLPSLREAAPVPGAARWSMPSRVECGLVLVAGLVWTFYNAGFYGFLSYVPSLMAARGHAPGEAAAVMAVATWATLPATVMGGWAAVRFGNGPVFVLGTLGGMLATLGPALVDLPMVWALMFGTVGGMHAGVIVAVGTLSARPENRAVGMGLFYTVYYMGGAVAPAVCGAAADRVGSPAGALVAATVLAAFALPSYALHAWWRRTSMVRGAA